MLFVGAVLYFQILAKDNIGAIVTEFTASFSGNMIWWGIAAIALMPINWILETVKWRVLIKNFETQSFWHSFKAIMSGVTLSIFTPNRIGEYGGRILLVKPENNLKGIAATLVGSFAQFVVLLSLGVLGMIYFVNVYLDVDIVAMRAMMGMAFVLISILLFSYYNIDLMIDVAKRLPYVHKLKRFVKDIHVLKNYSSRDLTHALWAAFFRYFVYTLQYYFLLLFFGVNVPLIGGLAGIAFIYLVQTSIPLPPIWGLLIRGEIALHVWGIFGGNEISILAATYCLWVINLILPALLGLVVILNLNLLKSLGYEK